MTPSGMFRPQRVASPEQYLDPPRVTSPTRMASPPRDFDPNSYQPPRDFNPNEPEGGAVRHRNVSRRFLSVDDDEENEKREYQYGSSSKTSNDYTEKGRRSSGSEHDLDSMPVLGKSKTTITRGDVPFEDMSEFFAEVMHPFSNDLLQSLISPCLP